MSDQTLLTMGNSLRDKYPKTVLPQDVVNGEFAEGLFRIKGGRALYDQVSMQDGGKAVYLVRIESAEVPPYLKVISRWIAGDTELEQMFEVEE